MPMIVIKAPDGRPIGTRWVSKHSGEAQPSARAKRKRETRELTLRIMRAGGTVVPVKRPERYLNTPARWRPAATMKEAA